MRGYRERYAEKWRSREIGSWCTPRTGCTDRRRPSTAGRAPTVTVRVRVRVRGRVRGRGRVRVRVRVRVREIDIGLG